MRTWRGAPASVRRCVAQVLDLGEVIGALVVFEERRLVDEFADAIAERQVRGVGQPASRHRRNDPAGPGGSEGDADDEDAGDERSAPSCRRAPLTMIRNPIG